MNYRKKHRATENGHLLKEMTETFRTSLAKTMNWCHLPVKAKIPKYIYNKRPWKTSSFPMKFRQNWQK